MIEYNNIERFRQLVGKYWKPVVSLLVGVITTANALIYYLTGVRKGQTWVVIGICICIFVLIRFPRVMYAITRFISGKPKVPPNLPRIFLGPYPYRNNEKWPLPGREREIETCVMQIEQYPFLLIEGTSGCGKTSLLNAGIIPRLQQKYEVIECRITDEPLVRLYYALRRETLGASVKEVGKRDLINLINKVTLANKAESVENGSAGKPTLLCIDQFEELFVTVSYKMQRHFLQVIKYAIKTRKLCLIAVIRSDFLSLFLQACRKIDPKYETINLSNHFTLTAFPKEQAKSVLGEILTPVYDNNPLLKQRIDDFIDALVFELLSRPNHMQLIAKDQKVVIPVEMQIVGRMIESFGTDYFSVDKLRQLGGKVGLFRAYIEEVKKHVLLRTGVSDKDSFPILKQLIKNGQATSARTPEAIAREVGLAPTHVEKVLQAFAEKYLVSQLPTEDLLGGESIAGSYKYALMHEYLVQILSQVPEPILQKGAAAEQRLQFWKGWAKTAFRLDPALKPHTKLGRLSLLLVQPIPLSESLRLWRFARGAEERYILKLNLRGFSFRIAAALLVIGMFLLINNLYKSSNTYQIRTILTQTPILIKEMQSSDRSKSAVTQWCRTLVYMDKIDDAFTFAREARKEDWISVIFSVAEDLIKAGKAGEAKEILNKIVDYAHEISDPGPRCSTLSKVVEGLSQMHEFDRALTLASEIDQPDLRSAAFAVIAQGLAKADHPEEALLYTKDINSDSRCSEVLTSIAVEWVKAPRYDKSLEVIRKIGNNRLRLQACKLIIQEISYSANAVESEKFLREMSDTCIGIQDHYARCLALTSLAESQMLAGNSNQAIVIKGLDDALIAARKVQDDETGNALSPRTAANIDSESTDTDGASSPNPSGPRSRAIAAVAKSFAKLYEFNKALRVAHEIKIKDYRIQTFAVIAEGQAFKGMIEPARETARKIENDDAKSRIYAAIATGLAKQGQFQKALSEIENIDIDKDSRRSNARAVTNIDIDRLRSNARAVIVEEMVKFKMFIKALTIAKEISNTQVKKDAFSVIIKGFVQAGKYADLFAAVRNSDDEALPSACIRVAEELAYKGNLDEARNFLVECQIAVDHITIVKIHDNALVAIVQELARLDQFHQALDAITLIKEYDPQTTAYIKLAEEQYESGYDIEARDTLSKALANAHQITSSTQSESFANIAKGFARLREYRLARITADLCSSSGDRVEAYTSTLFEYAKAQDQASKLWIRVRSLL